MIHAETEHEIAELLAQGYTEERCRYCNEKVGYEIPDLQTSVCSKPICQAKFKRAGQRRTKRYTKGRR